MALEILRLDITKSDFQSGICPSTVGCQVLLEGAMINGKATQRHFHHMLNPSDLQ